ncbi:MAG: hypothetical protein IAE80_29705 [Anaerolinea sp.]|nr:hypothetical protein [Anaerolinea sp.]
MNQPPDRKSLASADYSAVKAEIHAILIDVARARQTITYSELCLHVTTASLHYHSHIFHRLLREVCADAWEQGDGKLCALVVTKQTGMPGGGYFDGTSPAESPDLEAAWRADLESVFELWSST